MSKWYIPICRKIMLFLIDVIGVSAQTNRVLKEIGKFILAALFVLIGSINAF